MCHHSLAAFSAGTESKYRPFISDASAPIYLVASALWGDDDSEEEEYFEEDYEGSFIDDAEEVVHGPGSDIDVVPLAVPLFEMDDENEEDEEVTEVEPLPVVRQRPRQAPIVISSDEEGDYADADAYGDFIRSRDEDDEDNDFHDAHSDSDGHVEGVYWSDGDGDPDDGDRGFYGYL